MKKNSVITGIVVCMATIIVSLGAADAVTVYVHPTDGPYNTIADGVLAAAAGDTVLVAPGTYGSFSVIKPMDIVSETGPDDTFVIDTQNILFATAAVGSSISGFTITVTGDNGIEVETACNNLRIENNIIAGCGGHGIYLYSHDNTDLTNLNIMNNTIAHNSGSGMYFDANTAGGDYGRLRSISVINNIIANNTGYGIWYRYSTTYVLNCLFGNNDLWVNTAGTGYNIPGLNASNGNLFVDPMFLDPETSDYHIQSASECIDAGKIGVAYNDPDGTRNNMGVYGGPGAAGFWPDPAGGPVVTSLSVTPASVPVGETLSLQATGEIR